MMKHEKAVIQDCFDNVVRSLNFAVCRMDNGHDWIVNKQIYQKAISDNYDLFKKVLTDISSKEEAK